MDYVLADNSGATGTWMLIGIIVLALLFWLWMGFIGWRHPGHRVAGISRMHIFQVPQWQKKLRRWGIILEAEQIGTTTQELQQSWDIVQSPLAQYGIISLVLLSFLVEPVSEELSFLGQPAQINTFWRFASLAIIFLAILLLRACSYIIGVERLRRQKEHNVRYGDLQRRNTGNYRHWFFRGLAIAFVAITLATIVLLPSSTSVQNIWILIVLAILVGGVCIVGELLVQRIATIPRALVTSKPIVAREVDDMFRAQIISMVQGDEAIALAFLFIALWSLLLSPIFNSAPIRLQVLILLGLVLCGMSYIIGLLSYFCQGKLGGTVSGWPWQRRAVQ